MKNYLLFCIAVIICSCSSEPEISINSQSTLTIQKALSVSEIERALLNTFDTLEAHPFDELGDSMVSVLSHQFVEYITGNPATLNYPFKLLTDSAYCGIATSEDGNFRIYTWYLFNGGSMRYYDNLYQWRSNGKVYTKHIELEEGDPSTFFKKIHSVELDGRKYYMGESMGIYSGKDAAVFLNAFSIDHDSLDHTVKLFETAGGTMGELGTWNVIGTEYDIFKLDTAVDMYNLIRCDAADKILYFPAEEDSMVGNLDRYQFVDGRFKKMAP